MYATDCGKGKNKNKNKKLYQEPCEYFFFKTSNVD